MQLRNVNLNLLPILQALLHEKSVTDAAHRLSMSQSAASEALGKLRFALDDPLLVRDGARMELTPRALAMRAPLDELCRSLDLFLQRPEFDTQTARRTFVIASGDYGTTHIAERLVRAIRGVAPGIILRFTHDGGEGSLEGLRAGEIDLSILPGFFLNDLPKDAVRFDPLFQDQAVAIFDAAHPLAAKGKISDADLAPYRMIAFHPGSARIERRHLRAFSAGKSFHIAAFVPDVMMVPTLVRGSLDFGIVPSAFRAGADRYPDIVDRPVSFDFPPLKMGMAWSPVQDVDVGHRWLRELVRTLYAEAQRSL